MKKQTIGLAVLALLMAVTIVGCKPQETNQAADILLNENTNQSAAINADVNQNLNTNVNANVNLNTNLDVNANLNANVNVNDDNGEVKVFNIDGFKFGYSEKEIKVKKGDRVKIVLTSADGFHDWVIDGFNAATSRVNTGQTAETEFVADQAGTFEYYCSVGSHRQMGMVGKLIVE